MARYADRAARHGHPATLPRIIEGRHLDTRLFLHAYEVPLAGQRNKIHSWRQEMLGSDKPDREKRIALQTIDDLWAEHLARTSEYRSAVHWVAWSGRDPHREYLLKMHEWFAKWNCFCLAKSPAESNPMAPELPIEALSRPISQPINPLGNGNVNSHDVCRLP